MRDEWILNQPAANRGGKGRMNGLEIKLEHMQAFISSMGKTKLAFVSQNHLTIQIPFKFNLIFQFLLVLINM